MRINPEYLLVFSAVAELGSVSKAAELLNLSQPAVSGQLKALQDVMGTSLYTRHARGIALTPEGLALLPHANLIKSSMQRIEDFAKDQRGIGRKNIRLGVPWSLAHYGVRILEHVPEGLNIILSSGYTNELLTKLSSGGLDLVLAVGNKQSLPEGVEAKRFFSEDLHIITPASHLLAQQHFAPLYALSSETLLLPMMESNVRKHVELLLEKRMVYPHSKIEVGSFSAVREGILRHLGVTVAPKSMVHLELRLGLFKAIGIEDTGTTLEYYVVSAPERLLPKEVRSVLETLANVAIYTE